MEYNIEKTAKQDYEKVFNYIEFLLSKKEKITIEDLQKRGCWVIGADMDGDDHYTVNMTGPLVLVIGAEGKGLGRLVKQKCDTIASIPMGGGVSSLNASAAGAILMYEAVRQRRMAGK